jgi:hypothetical protein
MSKFLTAAEITALLTPVAGAAKAISSVDYKSGAADIEATLSGGHGLVTDQYVVAEGIHDLALGIFKISVATNVVTLVGSSGADGTFVSGNLYAVTAGLLALLKPGDLYDVQDALSRRQYTHVHDQGRANQERVDAILA